MISLKFHTNKNFKASCFILAKICRSFLFQNFELIHNTFVNCRLKIKKNKYHLFFSADAFLYSYIDGQQENITIMENSFQTCIYLFIYDINNNYIYIIS